MSGFSLLAQNHVNALFANVIFAWQRRWAFVSLVASVNFLIAVRFGDVIVKRRVRGCRVAIKQGEQNEDVIWFGSLPSSFNNFVTR